MTNSNEELNHVTEPYGPSSEVICKVTTGNVCGSGSHVGVRNGKSLVLTNAHVAGTRPGKRCTCTFPRLGNKQVGSKIIMAGYSDRIMMDWAVLELDELLDLPYVKLCNQNPSGQHYTGGYPRCRGPYYQKLVTRGFTYGGTVWKWQPNSIGGQSGSGVHAFSDNLQYGLLTWSWGGDGAGQTTRSIWAQYVARAAIGEPRVPGLVELSNRVDDLEEGVFFESNITTLPIWAHLDEDPKDPTPEEGCPKLAAKLREEAKKLQDQANNLAELANKYGADNPNPDPDNPITDEPTFGL